MEELQDAIEDAQYVSAISSVDDGPRPVVPWDIPEEEELSTWKSGILSKYKLDVEEKNNNNKTLPAPFDYEWTLSHALGFFLFSAYLKDEAVCGDHVEINFMEEVLRWKGTRGRLRAEKTSFIISNYLAPLSEEEQQQSAESAAAEKKGKPNEATLSSTSETATTTRENGVNDNEQTAEESASASLSSPHKITPLAGPPKTQINEYDLAREPTSHTSEEIQEMRTNNFDPTKTCVGISGKVLASIYNKVDKLRNAPGYGTLPKAPIIDGIDGGDSNTDNDTKQENGDGNGDKLANQRSVRAISLISNELPENLFDEAEVIVAENVCDKHWTGFQGSEYHTKLLNFLWFQDRKVVEEDFFLMRVLGRGGFGLVTACKKGTSGKLYAMKVMNKKRIKIKKAEQLTLNEQICLADVNSPFVVNLKYSFQSEIDVFLVLDLMTGGDLSFHLGQKGRFPKKECLYYGARIMLGLQALHDKGYVYRDLKPENCLLGEDGRVKLTDLGLATRVTPKLHGAAGTRGYWAPEMLRRDENGKRMNYNHMVDWFSFGCCLAEFISGTNPFRSKEALDFGLDKGKKTKEKAIDYATLEMHPEFDAEKFNEDAADICRRLLDKSEATRLGVTGCKEIMSHPWFRDVNWEEIITDRMRPPFIPPKDVNAASQSEIGTFAEDKTFHEAVLSEKDHAVYDKWEFTNSKAFAAEVIEFLIYERETGEPLLPIQPNAGCCCTII